MGCAWATAVAAGGGRLLLPRLLPGRAGGRRRRGRALGRAPCPRKALVAVPTPSPAMRNMIAAEIKVSRITEPRPKRAFQCSPSRRCADGLG